MNINSNTLLNLVLVNNNKLIIRAVEIAAGLWDEDKQPKSVELRVTRKQFLQDDPRLEEMTGTQRDDLKVILNIVACNPLDMNRPYCVELPNGKTEWIGAEQTYV